MNFRSLLFSILFGCAACAPARWNVYPPPDGPPPSNLPTIRPLNSLGPQGGTTSTSAKANEQQLPLPPTGPPAVQNSLSLPDDTCGVKEAWEGRGKLIQGWPDVDVAHETTFEGQPAVITKNTVSLTRDYFLPNDLKALDVTGQLVKYSTERSKLSKTYYIVRKKIGDTWEMASRSLSLEEAKPLITFIKNYYQRKYGIIPADDPKLYAFFKKEETKDSKYVGAVPISFKGSSVPKGKLIKVNSARYCEEKWK